MSSWGGGGWNNGGGGGGGGVPEAPIDGNRYGRENATWSQIDSIDNANGNVSLDANGNVGIGTTTPTDYGVPGAYRVVQQDASTLVEWIQSIGGTRIGSMLASLVGLVISSDAFDLFLAANTNNQINLRASGEIQIPNLNSGAGTRALRWNDSDGELFQVEMGLYVEAVYSGTGPLDITAGGGIVPADAASTLMGFTQTPSFTEFTCTIAGVYEITGRVAGNMTGGNNRTIWTSWIEIDGARADFSFAQVYSRNSAHGDFSLETKMVIALGVGQVVALVQGRKIGSGTGPFEGTGTGLQITRIG